MSKIPPDKYCKGCDTTKLRTEFHKNGISVMPTCKICRQKERRALNNPRKKGTKYCARCDKNLLTKNFNSDKMAPDGLQSYCKECKKQQMYKRCSTFDGFTKNLFKDLRWNAKRRNIQVQITHKDIITLYKKQKGLCVYTKKQMTHECKERDTHQHIMNKWNISVDRIISSKPYTKDNIQLLCGAINRLKSNLNEKFFLYLCYGIAKANFHRLNKYKLEQIGGNYPLNVKPKMNYFLEYIYNTTKRELLFETTMQRWANKNVNNFIKKLYLSAKHNCKNRNKKLRFLITEDNVFCQYQHQKGLCAITGLTMTRIGYQQKDGDDPHYWNISIDRIDSTRSYSKNNIQLVCNIVNKMKIDMDDHEFIDMCNNMYWTCTGYKTVCL
jgi:hypothetical protein